MKNVYVYVVFKDADFVEGRGPMRVHLIFSKFEDAHNWIMSQKGIMGTEQSQGVSGNSSRWSYNGYAIHKHKVYEDSISIIQAAERKKELEKQIEELKEELGAISNV